MGIFVAIALVATGIALGGIVLALSLITDPPDRRPLGERDELIDDGRRSR